MSDRTPAHGLMFTPDLARRVHEGTKTTTLRPPIAQNSLVNGWGVRRFEAGYDWSRAFVDRGPSPAGNAGPYLHVPRLVEGGTDPALDEVVERIYPRVQVGDWLWARETWTPVDHLVDGIEREDPVCVGYRADLSAICHEAAGRHAIDTYAWNWNRLKWRPSILMPKWAARSWMCATAVDPVDVRTLDDAAARLDGFASLPALLTSLDATYGRWASWPWLWRYRWAEVLGQRPVAQGGE